MAARFATRTWSATLGTLLLSGFTVIGVSGFAGVAHAASPPPAAVTTTLAPVTLAPITHPEADTPGSQIRLHEPVAASSAAASASGAGGFKPLAGAAQPYGMDVSNYQGNVDWTAAKKAGAAFVYIKATENTNFQNAYFAQQYNGSYAAGLVRGAYHFALPDRSSGATQATYFVAHGGGWSADGSTLPPMLDIEYNPYGSSVCYGLTASKMVSWIRDFSNTVHASTGRYPVVYTSADWWNTCTGRNATFGATNPLFIARWASTPGVMPAGWAYQTLWQYNDHGTFPGDADVFNGSMSQLLAFAKLAQPVTLPPVRTPPADPVTAYYTALGGPSYFGLPAGALVTVAGGQARDYQGGSIYYSVATGTHAVHGAILARYRALGGPAGVLGFPTTDELRATDRVGRYNQFQGSSIYWTQATGAHEVHGAICAHWAALGSEKGSLGYPTTDERATGSPRGRYSSFVHGQIIWAPTVGAHEIGGAIRLRWMSLHADSGSLGFPTSDEYSVPGGRRSNFVHGMIIWSGKTYATTVTYF